MWLYHRFPLSFREVEELMLSRGVTVSYETIRQLVRQVRARVYAAGLRRRQPRPGDKWHLDEVFIDDQRPSSRTCGGPSDAGRQRPRHPGPEPRRDAKAAKRFFRKLLKKTVLRCLGCWSPTSSEAIRWRIGR